LTRRTLWSTPTAPKITGLIDWDNAQTVPSICGFAWYPSWITRDWDPHMYGWPYMPETENSPEQLERYRQHYFDEMKTVLAAAGSQEY